MEVRKYIILINIFICFSGYGQNLILNGDFEDCDCPENEAYTSLRSCKNIKALIDSSPDYFNNCSESLYNPVNRFWGIQAPFSGDGYVGLILFNNDNYRMEYVSLRLKEPLLPVWYTLSMKISWADCSSLHVDRLGYLFTKELQHLKNKKNLIIEKSNNIDISDSVFTDKSSWHEVVTTFCASGGERELVIGTFRDGLKDLKVNQTEIDKNECFNSINSNWAYYYIDDIRLVKAGEEEKRDFTNY